MPGCACADGPVSVDAGARSPYGGTFLPVPAAPATPAPGGGPGPVAAGRIG